VVPPAILVLVGGAMGGAPHIEPFLYEGREGAGRLRSLQSPVTTRQLADLHRQDATCGILSVDSRSGETVYAADSKFLKA